MYSNKVTEITQHEVAQALLSVVGVCHGNLRVAWDTVQMQTDKNATVVLEEGQHMCCGPQKGQMQINHLTEVSYMLSGLSTVTSFIMSLPLALQ